MAKRYFPFDDADVMEYQWGKMARLWRNTGVIYEELNQLEAYGDSSGMFIKVKPGRAWIEGFFFESDAEEVLPIDVADAANDRIDLIVVQLDRTSNTIDFVVKKGIEVVPPTTPNPPALTETTSIWEIALAEVFVEHGAVTIAAEDVIDRREFSKLLTEDDVLSLIIALS